MVGEAGDGREAVALARSVRADVVLMDIRMPDLDGIEATRLITADEDLAGVRVLILTTFEVDENVLRALRAGASGFLSKSVRAGRPAGGDPRRRRRRVLAVSQGHPRPDRAVPGDPRADAPGHARAARAR